MGSRKHEPFFNVHPARSTFTGVLAHCRAHTTLTMFRRITSTQLSILCTLRVNTTSSTVVKRICTVYWECIRDLMFVLDARGDSATSSYYWRTRPEFSKLASEKLRSFFCIFFLYLLQDGTELAKTHILYSFFVCARRISFGV